jgi:hypothetical protein
MGTAAAAGLGMPGDSNDTIATARQRTQIRQHMRHGDTNGANACVISRQQRHHRGHGRPQRISPPHAAAVTLFEAGPKK